MLVPKQKKKEGKKCLITVSVGGSTISYKLVVKKAEKIEDLINKVLRLYHREGRLNTNGFDATNYMLNPRNGIQAPRASEKIGLVGSRTFVLSKKLEVETILPIHYQKSPIIIRWKEWVKKSLNLKILSN